MGFFFFSYYYLELGAILLRFSVHKENCIKLIYTVSHILLMSFLRQVLSRAEMKKKKKQLRLASNMVFRNQFHLHLFFYFFL